MHTGCRTILWSDNLSYSVRNDCAVQDNRWVFVLNRSPLFGAEEAAQLQSMLPPWPSPTAPLPTTVLHAQLEHCKCGFYFFYMNFNGKVWSIISGTLSWCHSANLPGCADMASWGKSHSIPGWGFRKISNRSRNEMRLDFFLQLIQLT